MFLIDDELIATTRVIGYFLIANWSGPIPSARGTHDGLD